MANLFDEIKEATEAKETANQNSIDSKETTTKFNEKSLIELGLLENELIKEFETPEQYLLYYSRVGKIDKLKKLFDLIENENSTININVKGNSKSNKGWSALHLACYFGHFLVANLLIEKKADVNIVNNDGDTPLHKASYIGRIDLVTLLLANKADIFVKNEQLKTPKDLAKNPNVLALLEEVEETDLRKRELEFLDSARNGDLHLMKKFLECDNPVNINCQDDFGNTALHAASFRNNKSVVTFLLQQSNIDTTIKNKRQQIPASLSTNISIKQLLLEVKPNFNRLKGKVIINRFEGNLLRRNRLRYWKTVYCVLEKGILSFYNNRADSLSNTRRRDYIYLESAIVEANNDNINTFTIFFNQKSKLQLQVLDANNINSKDIEINRQRWINALKEHIEYSKNFIKQQVRVDDDSDEDLDDLLPTTYLNNLIKNSQAHQAILNRHMNGLAQFIDEDLKAMQSELPDSVSIELSNTLMNVLKKFWPGLSFHLNLIKESASKTSSSLEQCLSLMDKQDKLRQLQLKEYKDKVRVLEEIIQALAQQQYDFEKSMKAPYKSPPRSSLNRNESDFGIDESDCEEYFDAFDDEETELTNNDDKLEKQNTEESVKIHETEEFTVIHDLQKATTSKRDKLPAKAISRSNISLWSILKNCIGKELSKITMPVVFNEPLSFLQRLTENVAYVDLVNKANESPDPLERMELVAAYAVACLSNNWLRMNKPFNPLLGETYEFEDKEKGFVSVCEQVSHHPPVSAYHVESKQFERYGSVNPKLKCWGKSIEIIPEGVINLVLKNHNEVYQWSNVCCCVHNVIVGTLWFEQYGKMEITCNQSDYKAVLEFKSAGWSGKDLNRLDGFIVNKKTKKNVKFIYGKWTDYLKSANVEDYEQYCKQNDQVFRAPDKHEINQLIHKNGTQSSNNTPKKILNKLNSISLKNFTTSLDIDLNKHDKNKQQDKSPTNELNNNLINKKKNLKEQNELNEDDNDEFNNTSEIPKSDSSNSLDIPNSTLLWMVESRPDNSSDYYNFTKFTFCLNEINDELKQTLPKTDSRFRPDIRLLEIGDLDASAHEKNRMEEKQREVRKEMKKNKKTYSPLWFKLIKLPSGKEDWRFINKEKYFSRDYKEVPDIF